MTLEPQNSAQYALTLLDRVVQKPEERAELCFQLNDVLMQILRARCEIQYLKEFFKRMCSWRRDKIFALIEPKIIFNTPPLWTSSWFIVECFLRLIVFDLACAIGKDWAQEVTIKNIVAKEEANIIERARLSGLETRIHVIRSALYHSTEVQQWKETNSFDDICALGCASVVCFPNEGVEDEWILNGRPTFTALRVFERCSTIFAAAGMVHEILEANENTDNFALEDPTHTAATLQWARRWKGDLADPHRDLLTERLLRALPENGCTPLDEATPAYWDSPDREGAEARVRPYAFYLNTSRPDIAGESMKKAREYTKTVWDEPEESILFEAAAIASLHHAIQQVCDVRILNRFVFDDNTPFLVLEHFRFLAEEKNATRYVPRLVRSRGVWFVLLPVPEVSAEFQCVRARNWADAIARWCVLLRDGRAKGFMARGKNASNTIASVLNQNAREVNKDPLRAALAGKI